MAAERKSGSSPIYLLPQMKDWHRSYEPNDAFLKNNEKRLETVRYGASFSPEFLEELHRDEGNPPPTSEQFVNYLSIVRKQFGISDIRLGIRWDRVVQEDGSIDLSYYAPLLSHAFDLGTDVTLNIGPIKTFRWPEQHVPREIMKRLEREKALPPYEGVITSFDPLGAEALEYADKLLGKFTSTFTPEQLAHIRTIQPENESFHKFGKHRWRLSDEYMDEMTHIIMEHFPDAGIMVNSSEFRNLGKIERYFKRTLDEYPQLAGKLISGINYYHNAPNNPHLPLIGKVDSITVSNLLMDIYDRHMRRGKGKYKVEASEAMAEMWPPSITPGNSSSEFRFVTQRIMDHILDPKVESIIRIWGIERLAKAFNEGSMSEEQQHIVDLVQAVNA